MRSPVANGTSPVPDQSALCRPLKKEVSRNKSATARVSVASWQRFSTSTARPARRSPPGMQSGQCGSPYFPAIMTAYGTARIRRSTGWWIIFRRAMACRCASTRRARQSPRSPPLDIFRPFVRSACRDGPNIGWPWALRPPRARISTASPPTSSTYQRPTGLDGRRSATPGKMMCP